MSDNHGDNHIHYDHYYEYFMTKVHSFEMGQNCFLSRRTLSDKQTDKFAVKANLKIKQSTMFWSQKKNEENEQLIIVDRCDRSNQEH